MPWAVCSLAFQAAYRVYAIIIFDISPNLLTQSPETPL